MAGPVHHRLLNAVHDFGYNLRNILPVRKLVGRRFMLYLLDDTRDEGHRIRGHGYPVFENRPPEVVALAAG